MAGFCVSASADGQVTITFDSNGGTAVSAITVESGTAVSEPSSPTRAGWDSFGGWYTDQACTSFYGFGEPVTADITLYALWERHVPRKEATCTEAGNDEYWQKNNKYYSDNDFSQETTLAALTLGPLAHNYVNGVCTRCDEPDPVRFVGATEPTCTEPGNAAYYVKDGKYYTDITCTVETSPSEAAVPALGHDYENGICTRCNANQPVIPHSATEPTCTEPGHSAYYQR